MAKHLGRPPRGPDDTFGCRSRIRFQWTFCTVASVVVEFDDSIVVVTVVVVVDIGVAVVVAAVVAVVVVVDDADDYDDYDDSAVVSALPGSPNRILAVVLRTLVWCCPEVSDRRGHWPQSKASVFWVEIPERLAGL